MEKTIKRIKGEILVSKQYNEPVNVIDWDNQYGILLTRKEALEVTQMWEEIQENNKRIDNIIKYLPNIPIDESRKKLIQCKLK